MGASTQDMINQLQAQLAVGQQPTFGGIQGQADPNALQGLLAKLKGQQYVQQAGGDNGDPYGFLTAPSRRSAAALGQQMGSMLNGPAATPPAAPQAPLSMPPPADQGAAPAAAGTSPAVPVPTPAPGATKQETENNELRAAQAYNRALIKSGMPADQAKVETLTKLVDWGHPQAADALATAQDALTKNDHMRAETGKNISQGKMDAANIDNQARELHQNTWTDVKDLPEGTLQINGLGEKRFVKTTDRAGVPQTAQEDANADLAAGKIAQYETTMGTVMGRGGTKEARQDMIARVLKINPDWDEKNFKASGDAIKAYGPSGTQGQMVLRTQNAMNHLAALKEWGKALSTGDSTTANAIGNSIARQFNSPALATYNTAAPIIANEVSSAIIKGGGGVKERMERAQEFADTKNDAAREGSINAAGSLLGAQYKNHENFYKTSTFRNDFEKRFPVQGGFPAPPRGPDASAETPSDGWGKAVKH